MPHMPQDEYSLGSLWLAFVNRILRVLCLHSATTDKVYGGTLCPLYAVYVRTAELHSSTYRVKPWAADVWRRTCEVREER